MGTKKCANAIPSPLQTHPELRQRLGHVPKLFPPSKKGAQKHSELKISKTHPIAIPNTSGASQKIEPYDKLFPASEKERAPNPKHDVKQHWVMWNVGCGLGDIQKDDKGRAQRDQGGHGDIGNCGGVHADELLLVLRHAHLLGLKLLLKPPVPLLRLRRSIPSSLLAPRPLLPHLHHNEMQCNAMQATKLQTQPQPNSPNQTNCPAPDAAP